MRRFTVALIALLALAVPVLFAGLAVAGGPTSVLLSAPEKARTASLYVTDPDYDELTAQLSGDTSGEAQNAGESYGEHGTGPYVTVTWLIHDVNVWRVDRIFYQAPGGPWVLTQLPPDGGDPFSHAGFWHVPVSGVQLRALLNRLLLDAPASAGRSAVTSAVESTVTAVDPPSGGTGNAGTGGWVWGLVGLAGGVVLTLLTIEAIAVLRRPRRLPVADLPVFDGTG